MMRQPSTARTVIGSGGKLFDPSQLPGLAAWYSADYGVLSQATNAASFVAANSQSLSAASNSSLQTGTAGVWEISCWINPASLNESDFGVYIGKASTSNGNQQDYVLFRPASGGTTLRLIVSAPDGASQRTINTGAINAVGTWVFVTFGCDGTNAFIRVNNGAVLSGGIAGYTYQGNGPLTIGGSDAWGYYSSSKIAMVGFWKRNLTSDERTFLYQNGTGRLYGDLPDTLKTELVSYWNLSELSGIRADSHGTNHLAANNNPAPGISPYTTDASDGQTVRRWLDRSGNARHLDQSTLTNQPTFYAAYASNGRSTVRSLGTGSFQLTGLPSTGEETHYTVFSAAGSNYVTDGHTFASKGFWIASNSSSDVIIGGNGMKLSSPSSVWQTVDTTALGIVAIRFSVAQGKQMFIGTRDGYKGIIMETSSPSISAIQNTTAITLFRHGSGTAASNCNISEHMRFWGQVHDDITMRQMISYLARKWGISL